MNSEEATKIIRAELDLIDQLKHIACLPEALWLPKAISLFGPASKRAFSEEETEEKLETYRVNMLVERMHLGRSVQPSGTLYDLAPIVGSIRRGSPGKIHAVNFLLAEVLGSLGNPASPTFKLLQEFSQIPLGTHRNCRVWDAFVEVMDRKSRPLDGCAGGTEIVVTTLPNTLEVRHFGSSGFLMR